MAWAYPPYKPAAFDVLDMERFNENVSEFMQETNGNLNEHNFRDSSLQELADADLVADDLAIKIFHRATSLTPLSSDYPLTFSTDWKPVTDSDKTFFVPAGKLFVISSFQYIADATVLGTRQPGAVFALELDGAIQTSSLLGAGDTSNEYTLNETTSTPAINYDSSPSFRGLWEPKQVTGTFVISAGEHTIRLAYRNLASFGDISSPFQWISSREMICQWMWA